MQRGGCERAPDGRDAVDIEGFLSSLNLFDIAAFLFLFGMFVLGFAQGSIRRLLGLAAILFSFFLAGQLRDPLGNFLAQGWTQFPQQYSLMLAYLFVFGFSAILFSIIIQSFYKHQPLFENATAVDEVIGGLIGILQGLVLIGSMIVILDSYFLLPVGAVEGPNELPFLRPIFDLYTDSWTAGFFRDVLLPAFFALVGALVPEEVRALYETTTPTT
jgi:uncharacterized membrane protein required for colicin V production